MTDKVVRGGPAAAAPAVSTPSGAVAGPPPRGSALEVL